MKNREKLFSKKFTNLIRAVQQVPRKLSQKEWIIISTIVFFLFIFFCLVRSAHQQELSLQERYPHLQGLDLKKM
jgi:hypothetical protein